MKSISALIALISLCLPAGAFASGVNVDGSNPFFKTSDLSLSDSKVHPSMSINTSNMVANSTAPVSVPIGVGVGYSVNSAIEVHALIDAANLSASPVTGAMSLTPDAMSMTTGSAILGVSAAF